MTSFAFYETMEAWVIKPSSIDQLPNSVCREFAAVAQNKAVGAAVRGDVNQRDAFIAFRSALDPNWAPGVPEVR